MRNYVEEMKIVARKRNLSNIFPVIWSSTYFIGYSVLIFMYNRKYYETFFVFSIPLAFAALGFALERTLLNDNERELKNEIKEARNFLEKSSGKADNEGINTLVGLYRSGKEDRKWESINDMLREAFPEKSELRKTIGEIIGNE